MDMATNSEIKPLKVLFDEKQFRGNHPGEQTYAKLLIEQFLIGGSVKPYLLTSEAWSEPISPRCAALVSSLPTFICTYASDRELIRQRPMLWQKIANRAYRNMAASFDMLTGSTRLSTALQTSPDIIHLSRFHMFKPPRKNRPLAVATVHDVISLVRPEFFPPDVPAYTKKLIRYYMRYCDHIIAVSETTRRDLLNFFDLAPERVSVAYNGIPESFSTADKQSPGLSVSEKANAGFSRYFLWVGTIEPRKNFKLLYEAFLNLKKGKPEIFGDIGIVVVGSKGWMCDADLERISELQKSGLLIWPRNVSDSELPSLYREAVGLVMPSFYEGFGYPVVEAMSCGCPVITSRATSMHELCGDSALLIDPQDCSSLEKSMLVLAENENLRVEMSHNGRETAKKFTAANCAEKTLEIYRSELEKKSS